LSQAANTFWVNRCDSPARASSAARQRTLLRRLLDGAILAIIMAACAACVSVYLRTRSELSAAMMKNQAAADKAQTLAAQVEKLERNVKQLQTDAKTIESFARQKYGYIRAGDVVIKVAEGERVVATNSEEIREANLTPQSSGSYTDLSN
jgi:cell division protein FtsB